MDTEAQDGAEVQDGAEALSEGCSLAEVSEGRGWGLGPGVSLGANGRPHGDVSTSTSMGTGMAEGSHFGEGWNLGMEQPA